MSAVALTTLLFGPLTSAICGAIDARTGLIPNRVTYPALIATLCLALAAGSFRASLAGAAFAAALLLLPYAVMRRRGIGLGDVKLAACIGASLGVTSTLLALSAAFTLGGFVATLLLLTGRASRGDALAFGPFLTFGSLVALAVRWSAAS